MNKKTIAVSMLSCIIAVAAFSPLAQADGGEEGREKKGKHHKHKHMTKEERREKFKNMTEEEREAFKKKHAHRGVMRAMLSEEEHNEIKSLRQKMKDPKISKEDKQDIRAALKDIRKGIKERFEALSDDEKAELREKAKAMHKKHGKKGRKGKGKRGKKGGEDNNTDLPE